LSQLGEYQMSSTLEKIMKIFEMKEELIQ